jgi:hypothetical protein
MKYNYSSIRDYFFAEKSHINISICRILFYLFIVYIHVLLYNWTDFAMYPFFFKANGIFELVDLSRLNSQNYVFLWYISLIFSCFSLVGFYSKFSFWIVAITFSILNGLPQNYQALVGLNCLNTLILFVFCFSNAGDFYSIDQLIRKKKLKPMPLKVSSENSWPIHYVRFMHMLCYLMAGLSKLRDSGLKWAISDNLKYEAMCASIIRHDAIWREFASLNWIAQFSEWNIFFTSSAILSLIAEIIAPVCLVPSKFRWWILSILIVMHVLTPLMVLIEPTIFLGVFIFWIDWDWLFQKIRRLNLSKTISF